MNLKFNILKAKDDVGSVYKNVSNAVVRLPEGLNEYVDEDSQYLQSTEIDAWWKQSERTIHNLQRRILSSRIHILFGEG